MIDAPMTVAVVLKVGSVSVSVVGGYSSVNGILKSEVVSLATPDTHPYANLTVEQFRDLTLSVERVLERLPIIHPSIPIEERREEKE